MSFGSEIREASGAYRLQNWNTTRLRFVAQFNPSKAELGELSRDTDVSFLPMEAIGDDGSLDLSRTRRLGDVEVGYTYLRDGDVAIAKITPCFENGKGAPICGLVGGIGFGTTELCVLRPIEGRSTQRYLYWLLKSGAFRGPGEASMYGAGGQKRVPDDFVRDFSMPIPQVAEQKTIASFLDRETGKIDALVAEQEKLIALLKEKRQAVISHAVTKGLNALVKVKDSGVDWLGSVPAHWSVVPLKRLVSTPITDGPHETPQFLDQGVPFASAESVSEGVLDFEKVRGYISREDHVRYSEKYRPRRGDIYMVKSGATTGTAAIVDTDSEFNIWSPLAAIRCSEALRPRLLLHYIRSRNFQDAVALNWSFGTQQNIGMGVLENLPVAVAPLAEQQAIEVLLDQSFSEYESLIGTATAAISLLQERRSALISAAVTGQIDVRGLVAEAPV